MRSRIYMCVGVAVMMAACSSSDEPAGGKLDAPVAVEFTGNIDNGSSRASGTSWANGDAIGITGGGYTNIKYVTATGNGNFTHNGFMIDTGGIFFQNKDDVDFTAYYPFNGSEKKSPGTITANTTEQTAEKQTGFDFLWASGTANYLNPKVALRFTHRMTKLILRIQWDKDNSGISKQDFLNATFTIGGVKLNGSFDTATGVATASGNATDNWAITYDSGSEGSDYVNRTFNLILFPQSGATLTVGVAIAGQDYVCDITPALAAGNAYTYTISVKNKMLEVANCAIANWNDGGSYEGTAEPKPDPFNGHEAVMMRKASGSTPALYIADRNIGASAPEDAGLYFWWGDIHGYATASDFNFYSTNTAIITHNKTLETLYAEKIVTTAEINSSVLTAEYDAANVNWGSDWHIPSADDWTWMTENCTWGWWGGSGTELTFNRNVQEEDKFSVPTLYSGVAGCYVKSKETGEIIFLPAAGTFSNGVHDFNQESGEYWSASHQSNSYARYCFLDLSGAEVTNMSTYIGASIRPVVTK